MLRIVGLLVWFALALPALAADRPSVELDGTWQFRFAPDDRGTSEHWENAATPFDRTLNVPGCWDAQGIGEPTDKMRHNAVGVGWYRRTFTIPAEWKGAARMALPRGRASQRGYLRERAARRGAFWLSRRDSARHY